MANNQVKKIKKEKIKTKKNGCDFAVSKKNLKLTPENILSKESKTEIEKAIKKMVKEYGETLKLLGDS